MTTHTITLDSDELAKLFIDQIRTRINDIGEDGLYLASMLEIEHIVENWQQRSRN